MILVGFSMDLVGFSMDLVDLARNHWIIFALLG